MKTYTKEELRSIIDQHGLWLRGEGGSRANLTGAVHSWAQVAFMGHGERGRMLTAYCIKEGDAATYQCGCFSGTLEDLKVYIENGEERLKPSRTLAMNIVTELINQQKP